MYVNFNTCYNGLTGVYVNYSKTKVLLVKGGDYRTLYRETQENTEL